MYSPAGCEANSMARISWGVGSIMTEGFPDILAVGQYLKISSSHSASVYIRGAAWIVSPANGGRGFTRIELKPRKVKRLGSRDPLCPRRLSFRKQTLRK
jgi:hypothetical protein